MYVLSVDTLCASDQVQSANYIHYLGDRHGSYIAVESSAGNPRVNQQRKSLSHVRLAVVES